MIKKLNEEAVKNYPLKDDVLKLIEETTELNEVLIKSINKKSDLRTENLIEEVADVEIMIDRLKYRLDIFTEVISARNDKIKRQLKRIES